MQKKFFCSVNEFQALLDAIKSKGFKLMGPTVRNQAITYNEIESASDLPIGWTDEQEAGQYRLKKRKDQAYFGYDVGADSWKKFLFLPREKLWSIRKNESIEIKECSGQPEKMAFIGVRSCDLHAIAIQDKVFNNKIDLYEQYQRRRDNLFILAVNCTVAAKTCFCASMRTGPAVKEGFDLALTEVIDENERDAGRNPSLSRQGQGQDKKNVEKSLTVEESPPYQGGVLQHYFVVEVGSAAGEELCKMLSLKPAKEEQSRFADQLVEKTKEQMIRQVDYDKVHELLMNSWEYKSWEKVAKRCINCANCTLVCPTCFCADIEDRVSVDGTTVDRMQGWDSCFNMSHSYVHGGSVRSSASSRYRQWLTHKFGTWWDQFGLSGCVGCGRCITWCPVAIDVTEELHSLKVESQEKPNQKKNS